MNRSSPHPPVLFLASLVAVAMTAQLVYRLSTGLIASTSCRRKGMAMQLGDRLCSIKVCCRDRTFGFAC